MLPVAPDACTQITSTCSDFDSVDISSYDCVLQEYVSISMYTCISDFICIHNHVYIHMCLYTLLYIRGFLIYIYIYLYIMNLYHLLTIMGLFEKTVLQNEMHYHCSSCSRLKQALQRVPDVYSNTKRKYYQ